MEPYQQRVATEKIDLDGKIERLQAFLKSKTFFNVSDAERNRLTRQLDLMKDYSKVLGERIEAFVLICVYLCLSVVSFYGLQG